MELTTHVKKYRIFSRVFDIANQLLTRHLPFAPFGQIEGWTAKLSLFSIQDRLSKIFVDYGCQNTEKSVSLTDSDVQTLLVEEENQNTEIEFVWIELLNCFLREPRKKEIGINKSKEQKKYKERISEKR